MTEHRPVGGDWWLSRDFAVRSAGFAVSGLGAFGGGDESSRLREVAGDPAFREAVTWQNPAALSNAVDKVAAGKSSQGSVKRRREETVASYWQRYCAKNDTIGFLGPLAWGTIVDAGPALASRSGALVRERSVHLEAWGVQALAEVIDPALEVPSGKLWAIRDFYRNLWTPAQQKAASRSPCMTCATPSPRACWQLASRLIEVSAGWATACALAGTRSRAPPRALGAGNR
jgi:hypothetical protein